MGSSRRRVYGGFGAFIPLGMKIGLDADERLDAKPELAVVYYESNSSPCALHRHAVRLLALPSIQFNQKGQETLKRLFSTYRRKRPQRSKVRLKQKRSRDAV